MKSSFAALVLASLSVVVPVSASAAAAAQTAQQNPASAALAALFKTSDEDSLRRNPINALSRGDLPRSPPRDAVSALAGRVPAGRIRRCGEVVEAAAGAAPRVQRSLIRRRSDGAAAAGGPVRNLLI